MVIGAGVQGKRLNYININWKNLRAVNYLDISSRDGKQDVDTLVGCCKLELAEKNSNLSCHFRIS